MKWFEPTNAQRAEWFLWLNMRPDNVRAVAERFNPWTLYKLTTTGQRCSFLGCDVGAKNCGETDVDPNRVTVYIRAENPVLGEMSAVNVFGISPDSLEPWTDEDEVVATPVLFASTFGPERFPDDSKDG